MAIKVKNGTPIFGPSLCETCTRAHIARGYKVSEKVVICRGTDPSRAITFPVRDCTDYIDRTRQNLWEMEKIAWVLSPRGGKRLAGFTPPGTPQHDDDEIEIVLNRQKV